MHMASMGESRDSDRFLVNTQIQSHALLRRGFGTSVPFIVMVIKAKYVLLTHHCKRSFVFKVIVVTVVASSYSVRITRMILKCTFL